MISLQNNFPNYQEEDDNIGFVELDGEPGFSSTEEGFQLGDVLEPGVILHINCNNCTCDDSVLHCSNNVCEHNCEWSDWSEWSNCSSVCDGGLRNRTRYVVKPASTGGQSCEGDAFEETETCNVEPCSRDCVWSTWGEWSNCTECNGGQSHKSRTRSIVAEALGNGEPCDGEVKEDEPCDSGTCKTCNKTNTEWIEECSNFTVCPLTCSHLANPDSCVEDCKPGCYCMEGYVENAEGECVQPAECTCVINDNVWLPGAVVPSADGCEECTCTMGRMECTQKECNVDCGYTEWSSWSNCTARCDGGIQYRSRQDNSPPAQGNGRNCTEIVEDERSCNTDPCPKCVDEDGNVYEIGETINDEPCYIRYCNEHHQIVNETKSNCTQTTTTPKPPSTCQLETMTEEIRITDENGTLCVSDGPIAITVCAGSCSSYDSSPIMFANNAHLGVHSYECKCCQGTGNIKDVNVFCDGIQRTVRVMEFTECGCNKCSGSEQTATAPETCDKSFGYGAVLDNELTVTSDAQVITDFEPEKALAGSGSEFQVDSNEVELSVKPTEVSHLDGISMNVFRATSVTLYLVGENGTDTIERTISEPQGEEVSTVFPDDIGAITEIRVKMTASPEAETNPMAMRDLHLYSDSCL